MYNADSGPGDFFSFFLFLLLSFILQLADVFDTITFLPDSEVQNPLHLSEIIDFSTPHAPMNTSDPAYSHLFSLSKLDHEIHFYLLITTEITTTKILYQQC